MIRDGSVVASTGERIELRADTICIHGDTPGAASLAAAVRAGLEAADVAVVPPGNAPIPSGSCTARSGVNVAISTSNFRPAPFTIW